MNQIKGVYCFLFIVSCITQLGADPLVDSLEELTDALKNLTSRLSSIPAFTVQYTFPIACYRYRGTFLRYPIDTTPIEIRSQRGDKRKIKYPAMAIVGLVNSGDGIHDDLVVYSPKLNRSAVPLDFIQDGSLAFPINKLVVGYYELTSLPPYTETKEQSSDEASWGSFVLLSGNDVGKLSKEFEPIQKFYDVLKSGKPFSMSDYWKIHVPGKSFPYKFFEWKPY